MSKHHPPAIAVYTDRENMLLAPWFIAYGVLVAALGTAFVFLSSREGLWAFGQPDQSLTERWDAFVQAFCQLSSGTKLLGFATYLCLCSTLLPLPTSWIVSAVAIPGYAVANNVWMTTFLLTLVGASASVVANLNDYHLFTGLLRHRGIAKIRHTRFYDASARWFAKDPFLILVVFNFIPIPVDVIRILAVTYRYPRWQFVIANFLGRALRYAVIAFTTFKLGRHGWIATVALLVMAFILSAERLFSLFIRRRLQKLPACEEET